MDYSRQAVLPQGKLSSAKISIAGYSQISQYFCAYAAALGIGSLQVFDNLKNAESRGILELVGGSGSAISIDETIRKINRDVHISRLAHDFNSCFIGKPDIIADFTNDPESKKNSFSFALQNNLPYLCASSCPESSMLAFSLPGKKSERLEDMLQANEIAHYCSARQGTFSSAIIAAIALDEARKVICPIEGDSVQNFRIEYSLENPGRFLRLPGNPIRIQKPKKILIAGAGGIGTYAALGLAQENFRMGIYDNDIIEKSNLNRQILYAGLLGKNKAVALSEKLNRMFDCNAEAFPEKISADSIRQISKQGYDCIVCCVDNPEARIVLGNAAMEMEIPMIDSAVTAFSARMESYVPGLSSCFSCKRGDDYKNRKGETQGCASVPTQSIVMCNAFIGALVCGEISSGKSSLLGKKFVYSSRHSGLRKFRISEDECNSGSGCACRRRNNGK